MGHLSTYFDYSKYEKPYKSWNDKQNAIDSKRKYIAGIRSTETNDVELAKKKARIITDTILLTDNYSQTKAEDIEAFCQTAEIELVAGLTAFSALPGALPMAIEPLTEFAAKRPSLAKTVDSLIKKLEYYKNLNVSFEAFRKPVIKLASSITSALSVIGCEKSLNVSLKNFKVPVSKLGSIITTTASVIGYFIGMDWIVTRQVQGTRRARFECLNNELSDVHNFAILTDEQEAEVQQKLKNLKSQKNDDYINKEVKDLYTGVTNRVNVAGSVMAAEPLIKDYDKHLVEKQKYYDNLAKNDVNYSKPLTKEQIHEAEKAKQLYENIIKKVDNATHDTLERFEQLVYVGYGALFLGGFLEALLTEKLVDFASKLLKVNHPVVKKILSIGIPVITWYILNKNLAYVQNQAIKAVKYKKLKEFMEDKNNYSYFSQEDVNSVSDSQISKQKAKKKNLFELLRSISKDIKDYNKFEKNELQDLKEYVEAKNKVKLSEDQTNEAELMKKNTFMVMNKTDDRAMKYLSSIETISEIILQPLEMASTPVGAYIGYKKITPWLAKIKNPGVDVTEMLKNGKYNKLSEIIGAVIAFVPSAILEVYLTHKHRNALRVANMQTVDELKDYRQFADYNNARNNKVKTNMSFKNGSILAKVLAFTKKK